MLRACTEEGCECLQADVQIGLHTEALLKLQIETESAISWQNFLQNSAI